MKMEEELEKQESEIRKKILLVFIPVVIIIFIIGFYQSHSIEHNKEKYSNSRRVSFSGKIIKKEREGDYSRAAKYILLENYHKEIVDNMTYYKVDIGDSVYKKKDSDSLYFCLKNGGIVIKDYNKDLREKYLELLNND